MSADPSSDSDPHNNSKLYYESASFPVSSFNYGSPVVLDARFTLWKRVVTRQNGGHFFIIRTPVGKPDHDQVKAVLFPKLLLLLAAKVNVIS